MTPPRATATRQTRRRRRRPSPTCRTSRRPRPPCTPATSGQCGQMANLTIKSYFTTDVISFTDLDQKLGLRGCISYIFEQISVLIFGDIYYDPNLAQDERVRTRERPSFKLYSMPLPPPQGRRQRLLALRRGGRRFCGAGGRRLL